MAEPDVVTWAQEAEANCRGARFVRCALQVNPFAYLGRHGKQTPFADEQTYNAAIVDACLANDVEAIGITDHYEIDSADGLIKAATAAGITVFPGFEAVSSDGVHLLVLFDVGTKLKLINRCIGDCGIHERDELSPIARDDAVSLLRRAGEDWNAACVAAHAAGDGGLLKLAGQARIRAWRSPDLLAVALPGPVKDAPQNLRPILQNTNPQYVRERLPAVINAKDVCSPEDLALPSHSCWLKMSEISLRAMRMAFLDPESRVRLASDETPPEHTRVLAARWEGGFLDGCSITFSDDLNVLIGGPGAGKSTVIESLRYALDIPPSGKDALRDHEGIVRHVLRSGTTVSVLVRHPHPSPATYVVQRTVPNPPVVRNATSGEQLDLKPHDLLPRPEVYGQHEISEIASDPQRRTRLLERFRPSDPARTRKLASHAQDLEDNHTRISACDRELQRVDERLAELPRIEEKLERYRKAGVEDQLKDHSRLVTERQLISNAREELAPLHELLEELRATLPPDPLPAMDTKTDGTTAVQLTRDLNGALAQLGTAAQKALVPLGRALDTAAKAIDDIEAEWRQRETTINRRLNVTLRKLQRDQIDGQEFIDLRAATEELRPLRRERDNLEVQRKKLVETRKKLLVDRETAQAGEDRDLTKAAKSATNRLGGRVRVTVDPQADRKPLVETVGSLVGGRMKEACDALLQSPTLSVRELAEHIRSGSGTLQTAYGMPAGQADRLAALDDGALMTLEAAVLPTETTIELNLSRKHEDARWQPLEHLSKGQKATAILLLLLLESEGPLVVDQPEDDLDNTFISDDVVTSLRREKRARQFLFATHNANIPVLADAELIVGLSPSGEAEVGRAEILNEHIGSIDVESVRTLVEERLEGGHAAFEQRRQKYGI